MKEPGDKPARSAEDEEAEEQAYLRALLAQPDMRIGFGETREPLFSWLRHRKRQSPEEGPQSR